VAAAEHKVVARLLGETRFASGKLFVCCVFACVCVVVFVHAHPRVGGRDCVIRSSLSYIEPES
jgi:hypothetical protein